MSEIPRFDGWSYVPQNFKGWFYYNNTNLKVYVIEGLTRHRLDGPAYVSDDGKNDSYFIDDCHVTESEYWLDPQVIEYKIQTILSYE